MFYAQRSDTFWTDLVQYLCLMLSVTMLASKKLTIMHYMIVLNASKKENDTNYQFEIFYACAVIVMFNLPQPLCSCGIIFGERR